MFSGACPGDSWHVAGRSEDFGRDPRALRLFGEEIVCFRRGDGTPLNLGPDAGEMRSRRIVERRIAAERR